MDESSITVRYSKALFSLAKEKDTLSALKNDMELTSEVCKSSAEFNQLLKNPVIKTSDKIRLITLIFKGKVSDDTINFFRLVTQNKREVFIPAMNRYILTLIRNEKGIKSATVTTATETDDEISEKIKNILEKELGGEVELTGRVNSDIIGGIILRIDDKQYDGSILAQLKKIKTRLLNTRV